MEYKLSEEQIERSNKGCSYNLPSPIIDKDSIVVKRHSLDTILSVDLAHVTLDIDDFFLYKCFKRLLENPDYLSAVIAGKETSSFISPGIITEPFFVPENCTIAQFVETVICRDKKFDIEYVPKSTIVVHHIYKGKSSFESTSLFHPSLKRDFNDIAYGEQCIIKNINEEVGINKDGHAYFRRFGYTQKILRFDLQV